MHSVPDREGRGNSDPGEWKRAARNELGPASGQRVRFSGCAAGGNPDGILRLDLRDPGFAAACGRIRGIGGERYGGNELPDSRFEDGVRFGVAEGSEAE